DTNKANIKSTDYIKSENLENYTINNVLLIPYFRHNPFDEKQDFYTYSLRLVVYRKDGDTSKVIINNLHMNKLENIEFNEYKKDINKELVFKIVKNNSDDTIQKSENILVHEINNINMKLNENSSLKLTINASIEQDKEKITSNIVFNFITNVRNHSIFDKF
ncbi:MAG: hypothetical protein ABF289_04715, partial [Clostridiales bacterium]